MKGERKVNVGLGEHWGKMRQPNERRTEGKRKANERSILAWVCNVGKMRHPNERRTKGNLLKNSVKK